MSRAAVAGSLALFGAVVGGAYLARRTTDNGKPAPASSLLDRVRGTAAWSPPRAANLYVPACRRAAKEQGLPLDLITRMCEQESQWSPAVISGRKRGLVGEVGILQIRPEMHAVDAFSWQESIAYCGRWVGRMSRKYDSLALGVASWNGGEGAAIKGWRRMNPMARRYATDILEDIASGAIPS